MQSPADRLTVQPNPIVRISSVNRGPHLISVLEFTSGMILMRVDDTRYGIQEEIALREYIDAYEVYYDFDQGWMANGYEIPYKDIF